MSTMGGRGSGPSKTCEYCGAVYATTYKRMPSRDHDSFLCMVCGHTVAEWDSINSPTFTLVTRPPEQKPEA